MIQLPETVAAADLGSNSFHLIVARLQSGELAILDRRREVVRLAAGLDESNRLTADAQQRALECLERFGQRVSHMPPGSVRVVGTNTLRSARNAGKFIDAAEQAIGHPIEIISGMEEARLIYLGVAHSLADDHRLRLVIDIGGGSTELIIGKRSEPISMESLYMGCVGLSRRFFGDGTITKDAWKEARIVALQELTPIIKRFRKLGWEGVVGSSGTIRAIRDVSVAAGWTRSGITPGAVERLRDALIKAGRVDRVELKALDEERLPVFPGGVVILESIVEALDIDEIEVAEGALREGLLYDLLGRIRHEDPRSRSVEALAERYHVDREHAARVEGTALRCLDQVARRWELETDDDVKILAWAARLHEIGLDIAHSHYHRHGAYITEHADLAGFSRQEQLLVATLVQAHRRKFPLAAIKLLPKPWRRPITRLAILLRIAVKLNRSRNPDPLPRIVLVAGTHSLRLEFPSGWLDEYPLTRRDLEYEADYMKTAGYELEIA